MLETFKRHWPHYLAEAVGLAFFMGWASLFTTLLRSPLSPIAGAIKEPFLQLVALGVPMKFVIAAIVYSPWGKRSGAHINPAVTPAFTCAMARKRGSAASTCSCAPGPSRRRACC